MIKHKRKHGQCILIIITSEEVLSNFALSHKQISIRTYRLVIFCLFFKHGCRHWVYFWSRRRQKPNSALYSLCFGRGALINIQKMFQKLFDFCIVFHFVKNQIIYIGIQSQIPYFEIGDGDFIKRSRVDSQLYYVNRYIY